MTTAADVIRVAEEVRAAGLIYRQPYGWGGYVSIQQQPPYDAASGNDRFGRDRVAHCGIGGAFVLTRAGLRFGIDYPNGIQYSPLLARQLLNDGWQQGEPRRGDIGVIDWEGNGWGATGASDHVVLIMEVRGDTLITWECNTTPDGGAYYYERHRSQFTAWGTPAYSVAPPPPDPADIHRQWARRNPPPILLGVQS